MAARKKQPVPPSPEKASRVKQSPPPPHQSTRRPGAGRRSYDGAAVGSRTDGWFTSGADANTEVGTGLIGLRERSRDLVRNTAYGKRIIDALTSNLVASGIKPTIDTGDKALDARVYDLWERWVKVCYPSNRSTFYTLQSLTARAWFESGEVLVRRRPRRVEDMPGLPPIQLQVLEGDLLPVDKNEYLPSGRIQAGIEFDPLDRRVAYHLYRNHPGANYNALSPIAYTSETVRVPADSVIHLYQEARPGQIRGVPVLSNVIMALWDLAGYLDAERVRARAAACLVAMVEGGDEENPPDGIATGADDGAALVVDSDGNPVEQLRPGLVAYLPPGKKITMSNPVVAGNAEWVKVALREIASGVGLSYNVLSGDMGDANFAQGKLGLQEQHRMIRALRDLVFIPFALDPIWTWFIDAAVAAGLLPNRQALYLVRWSSPQIESVDRKTDAEAALIEMRAGLRSRREVIESSGRDPDDVDAEIALDNENRDRLGIVLDSDPRQMTKAGQPANLQ